MLLYCVLEGGLFSWGRWWSGERGGKVTFCKKRKLVISEQIRTSSKEAEAWLEPAACVITVSQTEILITMLIPKAGFRGCLFILAASNRPVAQQQLSLISPITTDLEALARKGAKSFVFFIGNLQLQGPVSLNPTTGQRGLRSKPLSLPKKQWDWLKKKI